MEVARHFPTTLNPTLWCDLRPITLIPPNPFGGGGTHNTGGYYKFGQFYFYLSLRQPIELGHQTTHRYHMAQAAYDQQHWTVVQAELLALVQAYRFFETAAYRRERLRVASELADFNDRLLKTLERRLEANQIPAADVVLARVESQATHQLVKTAHQDYVTALTDLRNQIGIPESAGAAEPLGEFTLPPFIPPVKEQEFVDLALQCRPDILAAQAGVTGTKAAENLARADRIPSPIIGPQYAMDEAGIQYIGLVYITPVPIWNNGKPLVHQRQADHQRAHMALEQARQLAVAQVRSALAKWNGASELVKETVGLTADLTQEVAKLEHLFDQGQADLTKLIQARQRLIQLKTAEIDATWAATQAAGRPAAGSGGSRTDPGDAQSGRGCCGHAGCRGFLSGCRLHAHRSSRPCGNIPIPGSTTELSMLKLGPPSPGNRHPQKNSGGLAHLEVIRASERCASREERLPFLL